jgi:hypothetical protein
MTFALTLTEWAPNVRTAQPMTIGTLANLAVDRDGIGHAEAQRATGAISEAYVLPL